MAETKNTKAFYNTEIPGDWKVKKLREILIHGKLGGNYENAEANIGIPVIKMGNLDRGVIKLDKIQCLPENVEYNKEDVLEAGDLLFNTRNTLDLVGKVAIWKKELPLAVYNSNLMRMKFDEKYVASSWFMNYVFNGHSSLSQLRGIATGTTSVAAIYGRDLETLKFALPPLPEQCAIAQVLSTADAAIHTTQKIIAQKILRKKWLMQQLLTGKKRLKGFSGEWKEKKLGEYTKKVKGKVFEVSEDKTGLPCITASSFNGKYTDFTKNADAVKCEMNDVLILWDGENAGAVTTGHKGIVGSTVAKLILKKGLDNFFIANHMQCFNGRLRGIREGSGIPHMPGDFEDWYTFRMPSIEEQTAIAQVLQAADKEISLLKAKAEKLREQKKGLMQQLLTGKKRLML